MGVIIVLYMDDMAITGANLTAIKQNDEGAQDRFRNYVLENINVFVTVQAARNREERTPDLVQSKYMDVIPLAQNDNAHIRQNQARRYDISLH